MYYDCQEDLLTIIALARYPSVIWLVLKKPGMNNPNFWASWICIFLGVIVTVFGSIGGLRGIIVDASSALLCAAISSCSCECP